jgi:hypothetical protein
MPETPSEANIQLSDETAAELLRSLLHKEGTWVDWGIACQKLQKAGYSSQQIFEQSGFQGNQQNLIIVAAQVYDSLAQMEANEELLAYFRGPRSDVLYELRILNQEQRLPAAELLWEKRLDVDAAREVAKALQQFSRISQLPVGFTSHPGDALAYQYWKQAKQKKDLGERSRYIAKGLQFAHSEAARQAIEQLLGEFTDQPARTAPMMPLYRLESEEQLSRLVPVAGIMPLSKKQWEAVTPIESQEPFNIIEATKKQQIVPLPGWQVVLKAENPVAILCQSDELPNPLPGVSEPVLVLVDCAQKQWNVESYFLVEQKKKIAFQWFEEAPKTSLLGQVILVLKPKKILDENNLTEPWQMDD